MTRNMTGLLRSSQYLDESTKGDISEYRGPSADQFPYKSIRLLGAAQLMVALLIQVLTVIQISIGYGDRYVFLATASVNIWTPLPAIAAGILGMRMSGDRYWETQCMKTAYFVMSLLSGAVFMVILLFVTGILESYYYDITDKPPGGNLLLVPAAVNEELTKDDKLDRTSTQKAIIGGIIALALLELIISFVSVFIVCCCAQTYKLKDKAFAKSLIGAHNPRINRGNVKTYDDSDSDDDQDRMKIVSVLRDNNGQPCSIYPCPPPHNTIYSNTLNNTGYVTTPASVFVVN